MARPKGTSQHMMVPCTGDIDDAMVPVSAANPLQVAFPGTVSTTTPSPTTPHRLPSCAATVNNTNVKASAAMLFHVWARNTTNADRRLKLYNKATAPVAGTDVPVIVINLPANCATGYDIPEGMAGCFTAGLGYAITALAADNDTTACAAGDITDLNILYA